MRSRLLAPLLFAPLLLAGCSDVNEAPENLSSMGSTPSGIGGADTTGDRTDSLTYQDNGTAAGSTQTRSIGTGAGSPSGGGGVDGGRGNPDVLAPTEE